MTTQHSTHDPLQEPLLLSGGEEEDAPINGTAANNATDNSNDNAENNSNNDDDSKNIVIRWPACCCSTPIAAPPAAPGDQQDHQQQQQPPPSPAEGPGRRVLLNMNHNVVLNLVLCITYGMSDSLWTGTVLAAYLKKLGQQQQSTSSIGGTGATLLRRMSSMISSNSNANSWVGNVEAASGLASLISALPVGYLADTLPGGRSVVLKCGGILLVVTAVLNAVLLQWIGTGNNNNNNDDSSGGDSSDTNTTNTTAATAALMQYATEWLPLSDDSDDQSSSSFPPPHTELYLIGIMALWGIAGGIVSGPAQALFADSTPQGKRSQYYMYLFVCYNAASCLGPLTSIGLFQLLGDDWDLWDLRIIMYVGLAMEMINGVLMMFFDDAKALDETETVIPSSSDCDNNDGGDSRVVGDGVTAPNNDEERPSSSSSSSPGASIENTNTATNDTTSSTNDPNNSNSNHLTQWQAERSWMIPYIIFVESLVFALGSGMTVKFFPLFFKDEVGMSPSQVQGIYLILPLVLAACSGIGLKISTQGGLGRVGTALLFKLMGVSGLVSMVVFKDYLDDHPFLLVPIYIMRTALMNASYPLEESILMDFVPKHQRGRWKSLESIAAFGWCGSAALGGWTSDHAHGDYTYTFKITAIIQGLGIVTWALLLPLVPRHEDITDDDTSSTGAGGERSHAADPTPQTLTPTPEAAAASGNNTADLIQSESTSSTHSGAKNSEPVPSPTSEDISDEDQTAPVAIAPTASFESAVTCNSTPSFASALQEPLLSKDSAETQDE